MTDENKMEEDPSLDWERMLEEEDAGGSDGKAVQEVKALSQNEIDQLLGGAASGKDGNKKNAWDLVANSSSVHYERLPMLDIVFDRLVRLMTTSLRNFTSDNVDISITKLRSMRFGDYLNNVDLPALMAVIKAEEWDNYCLMVIKSELIYSVVDVLLGGRRSQPIPVEGRPYTLIERTLVERMIHVILTDLKGGFEPISDVTFSFDRLETNPRFSAITRDNNAIIAVQIQIDMEDRGGAFEIIFPYATLEPIREKLLQMFMGEKFGRDSIWETHLKGEVPRTSVALAAVVERTELPLSKVLSWKPGSKLMLDAKPDDSVDIYCGEVAMFSGKMGQRNGKIAVQIEKRHNSEIEGF